MKLNKIVTTAIATLVMGTTSIFAVSTNTKEISRTEPMILAYYGQVNSNGTVRTKRVNGYLRSDGTYVNSYYRS